MVDKAWNDAWDIIHSEEGWKEEKKNDENGDIVFSRKNSNGKYIELIMKRHLETDYHVLFSNIRQEDLQNQGYH